MNLRIGQQLLIACVSAGLAIGLAGCGSTSTAAHQRLKPSSGGSTGALRPVVAISQLFQPLLAPLHTYTTHEDQTLSQLRSQLAQLRMAVSAGTPAEAKNAWLAAHLTWLELGQDDGAYGAFGNLGNQIDGTAAGMSGGPSNPAFTGFHRVELDLWDHRLARAGRDTATLSRLVATLTPTAVAAALPETVPGVNAWSLRAHEILEDALRDSLSQDDNYGSSTDLDSVTADVSATREMLRVLGPLIEQRSPELVPTAERELNAIDRAIADTHRGSGPWREPSALPVRQREQIDGAVDAALETLAPVSELMQVGTA